MSGCRDWVAPDNETAPSHDPDFSSRHESGFPLCKRCGLPVTDEQWAREACPGKAKR